MGAFELSGDFIRAQHHVSLLLRNSLGLFGDGRVRGAARVEYSFRVFRGVRLAAQFFNGYGESLLDYDRNVKRIGLGFQFTP